MFRGRGKAQCRKVRGLLSEYLDNRLEGEERGMVERHLETCGACSEELESLRMTVQLLREMPEVQVPRSFALREAETARGGVFEPRLTGWLRPAAALATAVLEPQSLSWLRPAAAVATVALVLVLMLDFLQVVPHGGEVVSLPPEQPLLGFADDRGANVSEVEEEGNWTLCLNDGTVLPLGGEGKAQAEVPEPEGGYTAGVLDYDEQVSDGEKGWPMRQIEIAIGVVVFILVVMVVFATRHRRRWSGA
ncbi:MAG TPA: hypothetical protein G4O13_05545 [Dehalococcoidia bacterium]|nr:hypothetical protein [Dehalococcoidia bacterium]